MKKTLRRPVQIFLGVSSLVLGGVVCWLMRPAPRTPDHTRALAEAVWIAESALEEAVYRLRHPSRGQRLLSTDRPVEAAIEPEETRLFLAEARTQPQIDVSAVHLTQAGAFTDPAQGPQQGLVELRVRVSIGQKSLLGSGASREVVRLYRVTHFHARTPLAAAGEVLFSQIRLAPEPLTQWVAD